MMRYSIGMKAPKKVLSCYHNYEVIFFVTIDFLSAQKDVFLHSDI